MYQIILYYNKRRQLTGVSVSCDDGSLWHFISLNKDGIKAEFPEYDFNIDPTSEVYLIYRDSTIISFFVEKSRQTHIFLKQAML